MKKLISLVLAASLLISVAACNNNNTTSTTSTGGDASKSTTTAPSGGKKEAITMWGSWSGDQITQLETQIASFNDSQDKYEVKYVVQNALEEKLLTAIAGGELPDILLWDRYNTGIYAARGALEPIDEWIAKDNIDLSTFYEPAVDEMIYKEKHYGLPLLVDTRILFYNKDMFEEAGVEADSIKDWATLEAAAVALTKRDNGKLTQSGFSLKDAGLFNIWLKQAGGEPIDISTAPPTTAFNSSQGLEVLKFWNKLLNEDKVYELGFEDAFGNNGFKAAKVAIAYDGPWALADYTKAGINYGVIANPVGPAGDKGAYMGGFGLALPAGGKNQEGAWEFMKWWTTIPANGVEFAKISGWIPANKEASADPYFTDNEFYKVFVDVMSYADIRPKVTGYSDVEGLCVIPQLQKFVTGEITAEEALQIAQNQGDKILAESAE